MPYKLLFLTDRGERHQQAARQAAPTEIDEFVILRNPSREQILAEIVDADFLFSERQGVIDREMIQAGKRLRLIQRLGSRTYDIDLDAAQEAGIPVYTLPIPYVIACAEHVVWQMLALARRTRESQAALQQPGDWPPPQRTDEDTFSVNWTGQTGVLSLRGQTVGVLGFGEIGWELTQRLRPFGCNLRYHKRNRLPRSVEASQGLAYAALPELLSHSRFLVNLLPYSHATDHLLNRERLELLPAGGFVVSVGSGSVIDEAALAQALETGHLAGAALDTFEWEPLPPDNPLLHLARDPKANVLLTPHTAALAQDQDPKREYENVRRLLEADQNP